MLCFFLSGEKLLPQTAAQIWTHLRPTAQMYNLYGPAECTLVSTFHCITQDDLHSSSVPIGRPLAGYICHVLDVYLQPVLADHHIGELLIGGDAVFTGYLRRLDLSKEALVCASHAQSLLYRTGDLVRIDGKSGILLYVGRQDFQIKLRGQRLELTDIETIIMQIPASHISNCVVVKIDHAEQEHLVAYIETTNELNLGMLRNECTKHLPLYMIPSLFILLNNFPLNQNGKLNRKALPPPDFTLLSTLTYSTDQPQTEMEQRIHSIWCQILPHLTSIPTSQNFFALGGNSLSLMKLHHLYRTELKYTLNITELFRHPTIMDHARLLIAQEDSSLSTDIMQWQSLNLDEGKNELSKMRES